MKLKLRTIEKLKIFGQVLAIGYIIAIILLIVTQNLSLENAGIALFIDFVIVWAIFMLLGDYR